jgi:hypothetical protein
MGENIYVSETVQDPDTRLYRAEIYELPDRERILAGPARKSVAAARTAAGNHLRMMLNAVEGVYGPGTGSREPGT